MGKFGKGYGHQHDLPGKDVEYQPELIISGLVMGHQSREKWGDSHCQHQIIISYRDNSNLWKGDSAKHQKNC